MLVVTMGNIECFPCARPFIVSLWVFSHLVLTQPSLLSTIIILIIYEMYNSVWAYIHRGLFLSHTVSITCLRYREQQSCSMEPGKGSSFHPGHPESRGTGKRDHGGTVLWLLMLLL